MGPHLALEVGVDVVLEWYVLEVAQVGVGLPALFAAALGHRLGLGVLLREDAAEKLLLGRLPARLAFAQQLLDARPDSVPVALRLAADGLVDGLHVVEQVRAGVEEASLVL